MNVTISSGSCLKRLYTYNWGTGNPYLGSRPRSSNLVTGWNCHLRPAASEIDISIFPQCFSNKNRPIPHIWIYRYEFQFGICFVRERSEMGKHLKLLTRILLVFENGFGEFSHNLTENFRPKTCVQNFDKIDSKCFLISQSHTYMQTHLE